MSADLKVLRILDANFNRTREGLRVCEDVARLALDSKSLSLALKKDRHAVTALWKELFQAHRALLKSRDTASDVGKKASKMENGRRDLWDLYWANSQRCKESLRTLEESVKLLDASYAKKFKKIRFSVYALEKRALPKLEALCDHDADAAPRKGPSRKGASSHRRRGERRSASR